MARHATPPAGSLASQAHTHRGDSGAHRARVALTPARHASFRGRIRNRTRTGTAPDLGHAGL